MAGLFGLKILLLWAGIIASVNCQNVTDASALSPPRTTQNSTLPSVTSQSVTSSAPRTMTTTPVMSSDTPTAAPKPPLTPPAPTSISSTQALSSSSVSVTTTPAITPPSPKTNETIETIDSQANTTQNQTSPTNTTSNTTVTAATTAPTPAPPTPPPLCSYTVTPIKFGLQITIISSPNGNYKININERGRPGPGKEFNFQRSNQTSSLPIDHLKPCTEYEHNVAFIGSGDNETSCNGPENTRRTDSMTKDDIKVTVGAASCIPGSVCYRSHWDISSSLQTSNKNPPEQCKSDNKTFCIKPDYNDICSDLTTTFTSGNCADSSFNIITNIPVDFLVLSEIKPTPLNQLPAKINTTFPPNCDGLSVDYTCQEKEKPNESKRLSELEPFTDYSCTGQVNNNNVATTITTAVDVLINCDLEIINIQRNAANTSIDLSWITTSQNCQDLPTLEKLSFDCSCSPTASKWKHGVTVEVKKHPAGGSCRVTGLEPFTDYTCDIQPTYNNKKVRPPTQVTQKTETGKPEDIEELTVFRPEHNVIKVTCNYRKKINGHERKFNARLYDSSGTLKMEKLGSKNCDFEFSDLSYSTTYTVKVTVFNEKFESNPKIKDISTSYNDSFIIRLFFYMAFIIYVVLNVVIYKIYVWRLRKSINVVNEDVMLESTASYENDPQSEERL